MTGIGDNSTNGQLRAFIERIERLEEEKKRTAEDIKDVYAEAKGNGFDVKIMRKVVSLRKQDLNKRREEAEILDVYMAALGMLADTPLGRSAIERAAASPALKRAVKGLGTPVELTDDEREKGQTAAFVKDGMRMSIGIPKS